MLFAFLYVGIPYARVMSLSWARTGRVHRILELSSLVENNRQVQDPALWIRRPVTHSSKTGGYTVTCSSI